MISSSTRTDEASAVRGYRAVWRWHFFAALWTAPFLIILTLTGAIYLFDREIDGWWHRGIQSVDAGVQPLSLARQEGIVLAAYRGGTISRVRMPRTGGEAAVWNLTAADGAEKDVYLDPYRGRISGTVDPALQPMNIVRKIHATLLGGDTGGYIVELVACWALVMMVTGIWLWWPRRWTVRGVFLPRFAARGRRFWRDLHSIPLIFNAAFVIFLILTGLPWSAFWGVQFARIGQVVPFVAASPNFGAPPETTGKPALDPHAAHRQDPDSAKIPWVIKHMPMPMPHGMGHRRVGMAEVEAMLPRLDRAQYGGGVRIFYPKGPAGVFMISYVPDKAEGQRTIYVDPGTGRMIGNIGWADYSPVAKAVEWGVMTHMGREYGRANQIANLVACLILVAGVVAGLILWWRRRPSGGLGAPERISGDRLPSSVKAMMVGMAILFPLVGLSMLAVMVVGKLFASRA